MFESSDFEPFFSPQSIAIVGASRKPGSVGFAITRNLIYGGYTGVIHPVNPKSDAILGNPCFRSLTAIGQAVDLAVIIVPAATVYETVREAADMGTRHAIVISAGFREIGGAGIERERRLGELAHEREMILLGPNCFGTINTHAATSMNTTFAREMPRVGGCALLSQSGAVCSALLDYARGVRLGISRVVSYGNKVAVRETDLLLSLAADPQTRVILMYLEELSSGDGFVEVCRQITSGPNGKPIVAIKSGRTPQGAVAAASHTGSLAGSDTVYDAILAEAGVVRVETVEELFASAEVLLDTRKGRGRRTAIISNAGGPAVMATDACVRVGLNVAEFAPDTVTALQPAIPETSRAVNPLDLIGDASEDRYRAALEILTRDPGIDQIMVVFVPQALSQATSIADVIVDVRSKSSKPIVACMMGLVDVADAVEHLRGLGVPTFAFPEVGMRALANKARFTERSSARTETFRDYEMDDATIERLLLEEIAAGHRNITEARALAILEHAGFPVVQSLLAKSAAEAVAAAQQIGYPVVLKIASPTILHKTEVGGVRLNIADAAGVKEAFEEITAATRAKIAVDEEVWGVLVQPMLRPGRELIVGMTRYARFGPMLVVGLGGIYAEAIGDVAFHLAPLPESAPEAMIHELRSRKLLSGVRGEPPSDMSAIADCLLRLSQFALRHEHVQELDINPLIVYSAGKGAVVADARIILSHAS